MATPAASRPDATEYAAPYEAYIKLVPEPDILEQLEQQVESTLALLRGVSAAEAGTRHAPYTWSIKEVVGHIVDCERIFGARALRFAP